MTSKSNAFMKPLKLTIFANSLDRVLQEMGAEQVCPMLRASVVVAAYAEKFLWVHKFFNNVFCACRGTMSLIDCSQVPQAIFSSVHQSAQGQWEITPPIDF